MAGFKYLNCANCKLHKLYDLFCEYCYFCLNCCECIEGDDLKHACCSSDCDIHKL